jgi:hypothetical protein
MIYFARSGDAAKIGYAAAPDARMPTLPKRQPTGSSSSA